MHKSIAIHKRSASIERKSFDVQDMPKPEEEPQLTVSRTMWRAILLIPLLCSPAMAASFQQDYEADAVGTTAEWNAGRRWFDPTPGATAGVIDTDSTSGTHSLQIDGASIGTTSMAWRDYGGLSSDGINLVRLSLDIKVNSGFANNVAVNPFAFHNLVWGSAGTPTDDLFGWPVNTGFENGTWTYEEKTGPRVILSGIPLGEWMHYEATLDPATKTADVTVVVLTGASAGLTGTVTDQIFQDDIYDSALDELRGITIFTTAGPPNLFALTTLSLRLVRLASPAT